MGWNPWVVQPQFARNESERRGAMTSTQKRQFHSCISVGRLDALIGGGDGRSPMET
jgi:hypothetical protein